MTPTLSQFASWKPAILGAVADSLDGAVDRINGIFHSVLGEQDALAESWSGKAASAAAARIVREERLAREITNAIGAVADALRRDQNVIANSVGYILATANSARLIGYEVAENGVITAQRLGAQYRLAGTRGETIAIEAELDASYMAVKLIEGMKQAELDVQSAKVNINLALNQYADAVDALGNPLAELLAPTLFGHRSEMTVETPSILSPGSILIATNKGVPMTADGPDGSTITISPGVDGDPVVMTSAAAADGSGQIVTTTTSGGVETRSVSTPRADGSGIIDTVTTRANGQTERHSSVPKSDGTLGTYRTNEDGSFGAEISVSTLLQGGGVITEIPGEDGAATRMWTRTDGSTISESYVVDAEGSPQLMSSWNSNGTNSFIAADGSVHTQFPNGSSAIATTMPDGSVFTKFSDGSVQQATSVDGSDQASPWEVTKSWTGSQWADFYAYSKDSMESHPYAMAASAVGGTALDYSAQSGKTLAEQAAEAARRQSEALGRMTSHLEAGNPMAGRLAVEALDHADDAARLGSHADTFSKVGKTNPMLTVGLSSYVSYSDWQDGKPADEAIANAVGSSVGGIAGAYAGAQGGAALGAFLGPKGIIVGGLVGGVVGGLGIGSLGGHLAEKPFK